jgi:hypothetical protein
MPGPELDDTSPDARRVQVELLRAAGPARRGQLAVSLSQTTRELALAALRRVHPDLSEQEIRLRFAEVHYGRELADKVRARLAERG